MFREAIDFYKRNPVVLAVALFVGTALTVLVLVDGDGLGIGEVVAIVAAGALLGAVIALVRQRG